MSEFVNFILIAGRIWGVLFIEIINKKDKKLGVYKGENNAG